MINSMKLWAIQSLMTALMTQLNPEMIRRFIDAGLDAIEDTVENTENTIDDQLALPLIKQVRTALNLPDNDETPAA